MSSVQNMPGEKISLMCAPSSKWCTVVALAISLYCLPAHSLAALHGQAAPGAKPKALYAGGRTLSGFVTQNGHKRPYLIHLPPSYDGRRKLPMIIVLHGGGGNYHYAMKMTGMNTEADKESFIVVYPNGSGRLGRFIRTWNAGDCCGYAHKHKVDDIAFLNYLIDYFSTHYAVDREKVSLVGFSNGAMLAYEAGCQLADKLAAIASVGGSMTGREPEPSRPLSVIIIHGQRDRHVPYYGGVGKLAKWGFPVNKESVSYAVNFWVKQDGCSKQPQRSEQGNVISELYAGGKEGSTVAVYTIKDAGHSWPGGTRAWYLADRPTKELSATEVIWQFVSGKRSTAQAALPPESVSTGKQDGSFEQRNVDPWHSRGD